jgi:hypothetical protein
MMNTLSLIVIGTTLGYLPESTSEQNLPVEQRVQKIAEWVKANPHTLKDSGENSHFVCHSPEAISYQLMFKEGEQGFGLRYCDKKDIGKIGPEDSLEISISFFSPLNAEVIFRETHFYDEGLDGFHPEKEKGIYYYHDRLLHRECVTGWLGTEYVEHLQLGGTSSNPKQDQKERQKVQDRYFLVLDQIDEYIPDIPKAPDFFL